MSDKFKDSGICRYTDKPLDIICTHPQQYDNTFHIHSKKPDMPIYYKPKQIIFN